MSNTTIITTQSFTKVGFIYNPVANKGDCELTFQTVVRPLIDELFASERIHKVLATEKAGGGFDRAVELTNEGCDMIVACGGDGTVHEVINGIKHAQKLNQLSLEQIPVVGIITLGTSDDFATHVHMMDKSAKIQFGKIIEILSQSGKVVTMDLGMVQATPVAWDENEGRNYKLPTKSSEEKSEYFVNICSYGISAEIIDAVNKASSLWNKSFYNSVQALVKQFTYTNRNIEFVYKSEGEPDRTESGLHQLAAIGNGSYFGNGMKVCPHASLNDGLFSVTRLSSVNIWDALSILPKLFSGRHGEHPKVFLDKCQIIEAKCVQEDEDQIVLVEADGELVGALPATFTIQPNAIRLVVPSELNEF